MYVKQIEASGDLVMPPGTIIKGLRLESVSNDCTAIIYNSTTQALGNTNNKEICKLAVTTPVKPDSNDIHPSKDQIMFGQEGLRCSLGISITLSGTTPDLYIYFS